MDFLSVAVGVVVGSLVVGGPLGFWISAQMRAPSPPDPEPASDDEEPTEESSVDSLPIPDPDSMPVALFYVHASGTIEWSTDVARYLFGADLVGESFERVLPDWDALDSHRSEEWTSAQGTRVGQVWSLYATCPGNRTLPVRVQRQPTPRGWWFSLRDMSGVHRQLERMTQAVQRLQQSRDEALHASRAKSTYLTGVAQVLRTPLNTIVGYGELVGEELRDRGIDDLVADVDRIHAASATLHTILETVLDWTEIEAGRMSVESAVFELSDTVHQVAGALRSEVEAQNNTLEVDIPAGLRVLGDARRTSEIVGHLLRNAGRYTEDGRVTVEARRVGDMIVTIVTDTGAGMEAGDLEELFVGFEQRTTQRGAELNRTGLSLMLAHTFAKMMGGSLTVSSLTGKGSTFMLELPGHDDIDFAPPMML